MKNISNSQFMSSHEFLICILYLKEVVFCLFFPFTLNSMFNTERRMRQWKFLV